METRTLPVDASKIGKFEAIPVANDILDELHLSLDVSSADARYLQEAAEKLRTSDVPVAFPTETVYGLGADATRSSAVRGIYKAKQRPSDNPLIVHFASLKQLRSLLSTPQTSLPNGVNQDGNVATDPIPEIYKPLISRFWPGPLTILLSNPKNSPLAPEVTAGLKTFGARIPKHVLALALIQLADVPVAAPSANASTKPSPTAAEHVAFDLNARIETILDGGPCDVGVESTVVDGLSEPPLILRPGGISLEQIRGCPGWENVQIGYRNVSEIGSQPKAPGMKYRHYSPKAPVILFESTRDPPTAIELAQQLGYHKRIGFIRTKRWEIGTLQVAPVIQQSLPEFNAVKDRNWLTQPEVTNGFEGMLHGLNGLFAKRSALAKYDLYLDDMKVQVLDIVLGSDEAGIAREIFSSLRELDRHDVDAIFVEGIDDSGGNTAAAVMNRLRKAAEIRVED